VVGLVAPGVSVDQLSYPLALTAGVLSFLSPCVIPLLPSYLAYITGRTVEELAEAPSGSAAQRSALGHALAFIAGFTLIFTALGATATAVGGLLTEHQFLLRRVGGAVVILFGLALTGWVRLPWLSVEKKIHLARRPAGIAGSVLVGMVFAAGWSPCIGPILASILLYASNAGDVGYGVRLLLVYSLGMGLPLLACAVALNWSLARWRWVKRHLRALSVASGLLVMGIGVLILTDLFAWLTGYLTPLMPWLIPPVQ